MAPDKSLQAEAERLAEATAYAPSEAERRMLITYSIFYSSLAESEIVAGDEVPVRPTQVERPVIERDRRLIRYL
jgi:hypothetical protein